VGLIYQGHYYLIPVCKPHTLTSQPNDLDSVRSQIAAIVNHPSNKPPAGLIRFVNVKRSVIPALRAKLHESIVRELDILKNAPIIVNGDQRPGQLPLTEIRQAERGTGDQAITIFDTGKSFVFDQSHIYFDGAWGAALAEIMTNEATAWARQMKAIPAAKPSEKRPYRALIYFDSPDLQHLDLAPKVTAETSAENDKVHIKQMLSLRKALQQRNERLHLTINDLLILYRAIHAATYEPSLALIRQLKELEADPKTRSAAQAALGSFDKGKHADPPIVIPIDASLRSPRERLYPMAFTVPLAELDILNLHKQCLQALEAYLEHRTSQETQHYQAFDAVQVRYLTMLAGFGEVMNKAKAIANSNETITAMTAKLVAPLPAALRNLLNQIPERIDILNDLIKGREIFSNVGVVVPSSTLTRFITAKDDSDKKTLCWGVMTDAQGVMHLSLRDFRPHVGELERIGQHDLALRMTEDYLESYVKGLNRYIKELREITEASRVGDKVSSQTLTILERP
jgi:hypothetical protein